MPCRPRALFLTRHLNSSGVTTHMMTLAKGMMDRGWEVALASRGRAGEHSHGPEWFEANGVRHFNVHFPRPPYRVLRSVVDAGRSLLELDSAVRTFGPDIIHAHFRSTSPYARVIQWRRNVRLVTTLHLERIPSGPVYRMGSFWGDRAIAVSNETRDCLIRAFGVSPDRIALIHNGVDEEYFRPATDLEKAVARREFGLRQDSRVVCLIGQLETVKGHDVLIGALARLRAKGKDVVALCAGERKQARAVSELASKAGVTDLIHLLGHVDSRKVLWASDALVLPSRKEGFALVIVEAMFCGVVPVRTPAAGALEQIEDGVNGFIVPFDDHDALALRLEQLFDDDDLRMRMSRAAVLAAHQKFTKTRMVESTLRVYEEILRKRVSPRDVSGNAGHELRDDGASSRLVSSSEGVPPPMNISVALTDPAPSTQGETASRDASDSRPEVAASGGRAPSPTRSRSTHFSPR